MDSKDYKEDNKPDGKYKLNLHSRARIVLFALAAVLMLAGGFYAMLYASTPEHMRRPSFEHYHFRTQIIVNGKPVDFSQEKFQEKQNNTSTCSIELSGTPIDFHDSRDQITHIHWVGISGGEFLKYYGWNFIGGSNNNLGYRYDNGMMKMHRVNIKGDLLPEIPDSTNFYIYVGDENGFQKKDWNDFLKQDMEKFFGNESRVGTGNTESSRLKDLFFATAAAHGGLDDGHGEDTGEPKSKQDLERINNLVGNLVIFAQENEPTEEQVRERFNNLVPVSESTCGG